MFACAAAWQESKPSYAHCGYGWTFWAVTFCLLMAGGHNMKWQKPVTIRSCASPYLSDSINHRTSLFDHTDADCGLLWTEYPPKWKTEPYGKAVYKELFYPTFKNDCCYYDSGVVIYRIWWSIFKQTMRNSDYCFSNKNINVQFLNCENCVVRLQNILLVMYSEDEVVAIMHHIVLTACQ